MVFQPCTYTPPVNRHAITAVEYDRIVAALKATPDAIDEIALTFNRSAGTIDKIRERVGIERRRLPYGSLARPPKGGGIV